MRDTVIWHFPNSIALESTIRIGDYKLVRNYDHGGNSNTPELELYRLYETKANKQKRNDGQVTKQEHQDYYVPRFNSIDKDGDGILIPDEFPYASSFRIGDANGDDKLTREEFPAIYEQQFNRTQDENKDGVLMPDEV